MQAHADNYSSKGMERSSSRPASPSHAYTSFPSRLHELLNECTESTPHIARWNQAGTAFGILDKPAFEQTVLIPRFKCNKYQTFTRKLNRWGFRCVSARNDFPRGTIVYHQEEFKRDSPEQVSRMSAVSAAMVKELGGRSKQAMPTRRNTNKKNSPKQQVPPKLKQETKVSSPKHHLKHDLVTAEARAPGAPMPSLTSAIPQFANNGTVASSDLASMLRKPEPTLLKHAVKARSASLLLSSLQNLPGGLTPSSYPVTTGTSGWPSVQPMNDLFVSSQPQQDMSSFAALGPQLEQAKLRQEQETLQLLLDQKRRQLAAVSQISVFDRYRLFLQQQKAKEQQAALEEQNTRTLMLMILNRENQV